MESSTVIRALAALAQENRLAVFRLLVQAGPAGMAAGRVGAALGLPSATLSFHLTQLRTAGLVTSRRTGRSLIYAAEFETVNRLIGFLAANCCGGDVCALSPEPRAADLCDDGRDEAQ